MSWTGIASLRFVSLLAVALALPVRATVYYVDIGSGSDSNNGTSTNSAWAHVPGSVGFSGSGWGTINSGSTIVVKGGTVNNCQVTIDSSNYRGQNAFNSILLQSGDLAGWGSGKAVFDEQLTRTCGFMVNSIDGVTLDGFEVRNIAAGANPPLDSSTGSACVGIASAHSVTVKRCWLHDALSTGPSTDKGHGIEMGGRGTNFLFYYNHIGPNIQMKGIETYSCSYGAISNNYLSGCSEHVITLSPSTNWDICNNVIRHDPPYNNDGSCSIELDKGFLIDIWNNLIFRNPATVDSTTANRGGTGIGFISTDYSNRVAYNVVAYFNNPVNGGSHMTAIMLESGSGNSHNGNSFYNNLVYSNANNLGNIGFCMNVGVSQNTGLQYNDVFAVGANELVMDAESSSDVLSSVAGFNPSTTGTFANNQQVNPAFSGGTLPSGLDSNFHPNSAYFSLSATSPQAVTTTSHSLSGDNLHGYSRDPNKFGVDILGNPRTVWSMGAYEIASAQGATVVVTPSSQNFGTLTAGSTSNLSFTIKNGGSSTLTGTATVPAPFQIASGGTYSLGANQSQTVSITYAPTNSGISSQSVTFTGGGGGTAAVSGTALPAPPTGLHNVTGP